MSRKDLTRWNRSGLNRLDYIDGNAITYLETLRCALIDKFSDPDSGVNPWEALGEKAPAAEKESASDSLFQAGEKKKRLQMRILNQYHGERRDWGWEIGRVLARSCHLLTGYMDAYANEGFLRTASQWDNVRRLVEMIGYHPLPPASAATPLIFDIKAGASGEIKQGAQVKYSPPEGGDSIVFETLADLDADANLNTIHFSGYGINPETFSGREWELEGAISNIQIGDPVVFENEKAASEKERLQSRIISGVTVDGDITRLSVSQPISAALGFVKGETVIHLKPADRLEAFGTVAEGAMIGSSVHLRHTPEGIRNGDIICISTGGDAHFRKASLVDGLRVRLDQPLNAGIQSGAAWLSKANRISVYKLSGYRKEKVYAVEMFGDWRSLNGKRVAHFDRKSGVINSFEVIGTPYIPASDKNPDGGYTTLKLSDPNSRLHNPQYLWIEPESRQWQLDSYLDPDAGEPLPLSLECEQPKKSSVGDIVVVASGRQHVWSKISNLALDDESGRALLDVAQWSHRGGGLYFLADTIIYSHFSVSARVSEWNRNKSALSGSVVHIQQQDDIDYTTLTYGRTILLERTDAAELSVVVEVMTAPDQDGGVILKSAIDDKGGFTIDNTVIRGNVVSAGHGELRPERILGSGDAKLIGQSFVLDEVGVAFVADALQSSGVAAAIDVIVGGRIWKQVASLNDSSPADSHYTVRMTEDGKIRIGFGDGQFGRRLPSGQNNVRIRYRLGTGLKGLVPAASFTKLAKPHYLVKSVSQPFAASGGNDMADADALRELAPPSVLTMERAVSLADFRNLAASHSSIWQADARRVQGVVRQGERIEVVVVPAGGAELDEALESTLNSYLRKHELPQDNVMIRSYKPVHLYLTASIYVNFNEYDPEIVTSSVYATLISEFSLEKRKIGQPLYLSEITKAIESIQGVSFSRCEIGASAGELSDQRYDQYLEVKPDQVLFIDPDVVTPVIQYEEEYQ